MSYVALIFAPLVFSGFLYLFTKKSPLAKYIVLGYFVFLFVETLFLYLQLPQNGYLMLGKFLEVKEFGFILTLEIDRLSSVMLLLTSLLLILVTLSSWSMQKESAYFSLLLFFSGAIFGVFMSTNLMWFFIFWELTLIPMYFLVGIWGGDGRVYAALKFFLYTHVASMFILLAFFLIFKQTATFDMTQIQESMLVTPTLIWWLLFVGFAVKMPLFPFHTWLPDAHVEASAPISVLLAGVLLKMGAYAMIRFVILMLPQEAHKYAFVLLGAGILSLLYAGVMALYETHLKKMVAYSSISHMGLVAIGMATLSYEGLSAALFEMIGHAFIIAPLFLIAGFFHYKTQSWQMQDLGGIMQKAPYISALFVLAGLGALGLPATMGFVGEITIFLSALDTYGAWVAFIAFGAMIGSGYIIWTLRRVIYGPMSQKVQESNFSISWVEFFALAVFGIAIVAFGVYPQALFDAINEVFSAYNLGGAM